MRKKLMFAVFVFLLFCIGGVCFVLYTPFYYSDQNLIFEAKLKIYQDMIDELQHEKHQNTKTVFLVTETQKEFDFYRCKIKSGKFPFLKRAPEKSLFYGDMLIDKDTRNFAIRLRIDRMEKIKDGSIKFILVKTLGQLGVTSFKYIVQTNNEKIVIISKGIDEDSWISSYGGNGTLGLAI